MGDLLTLLGLGFFIKVFFGTASTAREKEEENDPKQRRRLLITHVILGVAFIIIGRLIVKF